MIEIQSEGCFARAVPGGFFAHFLLGAGKLALTKPTDASGQLGLAFRSRSLVAEVAAARGFVEERVDHLHCGDWKN